VFGTYLLFVLWDLVLIKAPRNSTAANWEDRSGELLKLANRFLRYDLSLLSVAGLAWAGYLVRSPLLLMSCSLVSGGLFAYWMYSAREDLAELGRRVRRLEFR